MKRIAILTSGGDAPGMNACLRAAVRYAIHKDLEVYAVERGYNGLINGEMRLFNKRSVSDIIQRGGTILKTARSPEFTTYEGMRKASETMSNLGIDALIAIGGDGTYRGALDLSQKFGIKVIGIPGTIDNDLNYTDYTLGFDTACNTVLWAINNLRDTMTSHERVNILEVMGRKCGDIALFTGIAGGAEVIAIPEVDFDVDDICKRLENNHKSGKTSNIILVAEGVMPASELMAQIKSKINISIRTTVLGHIQRGGGPSMADRVLAAKFAIRAVDCLLESNYNRAIGIVDNKVIDQDLKEALAMPRKFNEELYRIANILSL